MIMKLRTPNFGSVIGWVLFSFNCVLVLLGLFLAVETRKVTSRFSKSTFIGLTTYNMVVLAVVFIPFFVVQDLTSSYNKQVILRVVKPELSPSYDSSDEQAETSFKGAKDNTMNEVHMEEIGSSMQGGNFNEGF